MKALLFFLTLFICIGFPKANFRFQADDDILSWSESRPLEWNDFAAAYDATSLKKAHSEILIEILNVRLEDNIPKYDIGCQLVKSKSWIRVCEDNTLQKQQLQFDIYELYTRKIRKSFDSLTVMQIDDASLYQQVFEAKYQESVVRNAAFQLEVNKNPKKLKAWNKEIAAEISQLESFAHTK